MRVALSAKLREAGLIVVPTMDWDGFKTGPFQKALHVRGWDEKTLFVYGGGEDIPDGLSMVSRNLKGVEVIRVSDLTVYDAIKWKRLILDPEAVGYFAERLAKDGDAPEDVGEEVVYERPAFVPVSRIPSAVALSA